MHIRTQDGLLGTLAQARRARSARCSASAPWARRGRGVGRRGGHPSRDLVTHICMHVHIYIYTHLQVYLMSIKHMYMYIYMCLYIYTYTDIHMHRVYRMHIYIMYVYTMAYMITMSMYLWIVFKLFLYGSLHNGSD